MFTLFLGTFVLNSKPKTSTYPELLLKEFNY